MGRVRQIHFAKKKTIEKIWLLCQMNFKPFDHLYKIHQMPIFKPFNHLLLFVTIYECFLIKCHLII